MTLGRVAWAHVPDREQMDRRMGEKNMTPTIELLQDIWQKEIREDFCARMLINEHTLQAALYHHLRSRDEDRTFRVVVEVTDFLMSKGKGIPDMVVLDRRKFTVEAVIELKCSPGAIVYEGDVKKLATWAARVETRKSLKDVFEVDPETLAWADDGVDGYDGYYKFGSHTNWIFAAIGPGDCVWSDVETLRSLVRSTNTRAADANFWLFSGIFNRGQSFEVVRLYGDR